MDDRTLIASASMVLTNGETYAVEVRLGTWDSPANWWEITIEEAKERWPEEFAVAEEELAIE